MIFRVWAGTQFPLSVILSRFLTSTKSFGKSYLIFFLCRSIKRVTGYWYQLFFQPWSLKSAVDLQVPILNRMKEQWNLSQISGRLYKPSFNESSLFRVRKPGMKSIGNKSSLSDSFPHCVYVYVYMCYVLYVL